MVSDATTAAMDLTTVLPALMQVVAQQASLDMNELKVVLVGDETHFDPKPFQQLYAQYDQVKWDYAQFDPHHNAEP